MFTFSICSVNNCKFFSIPIKRTIFCWENNIVLCKNTKKTADNRHFILKKTNNFYLRKKKCAKFNEKHSKHDYHQRLQRIEWWTQLQQVSTKSLFWFSSDLFCFVLFSTSNEKCKLKNHVFLSGRMNWIMCSTRETQSRVDWHKIARINYRQTAAAQ